jgi:hypothetical protein
LVGTNPTNAVFTQQRSQSLGNQALDALRCSVTLLLSVFHEPWSKEHKDKTEIQKCGLGNTVVLKLLLLLLVPQGSILSMTLFTIVISGIANTVLPSVSTSLYVDDTIFCVFWSTNTIDHQLQEAISYKSSATPDSGEQIFFFVTETQYMCFAELHGLHLHSPLFLNNSNLPFVPFAKLLGFHLDSKLLGTSLLMAC